MIKEKIQSTAMNFWLLHIWALDMKHGQYLPRDELAQEDQDDRLQSCNDCIICSNDTSKYCRAVGGSDVG